MNSEDNLAIVRNVDQDTRAAGPVDSRLDCMSTAWDVHDEAPAEPDTAYFLSVNFHGV